MASEYLMHKWRLWFRILDPKRTGQFSREDDAQYGEKFASLSHLEPEHKKLVLAAIQRLTDEFYFRGKPGPITEQEFVDMISSDLKAGRSKFEEHVRNWMQTEYTCFDVNGDGFITRDTFVNTYLGCGHEDKEKINKVFDAYNPGEDRVPVNAMIDSWVLFATCEDTTVKDVVKDALEELFSI